MQRSGVNSLRSAFKASSISLAPSRLYSSATKPTQQPTSEGEKPTESKEQQPEKKKKTQAELDKELEMKMMGLSGDGGEAGVELEDGQPVSMKRSVRNNMFRYI
ncbi:hypothetical protein BDV96DRAFT_683032 [Lophiotrema nucula]|uniref:Uncharacterized protein n=1 Tax=Lophiotrema nucula TaxID=690887 RepID=A0A6A5ZLV7_9PLEO|nr:hypothetical protein BDV96DRAFT_683032 [Lophiotrema nucula]